MADYNWLYGNPWASTFGTDTNAYRSALGYAQRTNDNGDILWGKPTEEGNLIRPSEDNPFSIPDLPGSDFYQQEYQRQLDFQNKMLPLFQANPGIWNNFQKTWGPDAAKALYQQWYSDPRQGSEWNSNVWGTNSGVGNSMDSIWTPIKKPLWIDQSQIQNFKNASNDPAHFTIGHGKGYYPWDDAAVLANPSLLNVLGVFQDANGKAQLGGVGSTINNAAAFGNGMGPFTAMMIAATMGIGAAAGAGIGSAEAAASGIGSSVLPDLAWGSNLFTGGLDAALGDSAANYAAGMGSNAAGSLLGSGGGFLDNLSSYFTNNPFKLYQAGQNLLQNSLNGNEQGALLGLASPLFQSLGGWSGIGNLFGGSDPGSAVSGATNLASSVPSNYWNMVAGDGLTTDVGSQLFNGSTGGNMGDWLSGLFGLDSSGGFDFLNANDTAMNGWNGLTSYSDPYSSLFSTSNLDPYNLTGSTGNWWDPYYSNLGQYIDLANSGGGLVDYTGGGSDYTGGGFTQGGSGINLGGLMPSGDTLLKLLAMGGGALLGSSNGAKQAGTTTTTTSNIPEWMVPYLQGGFNQGVGINASQVNNGVPTWLSNLGANQLGKTIQGDYLNLANNPQWQDLSTQMADAYARGTAASTAGQYARAHALDSTAYDQQKAWNDQSFGRSLAGLAGQIYGQERTNQERAATVSPDWANTYQQVPYGNTNAYLNLMRGWGGSQSTPYYTNPTAGAIGGLLAGASLFGKNGIF